MRNFIFYAAIVLSMVSVITGRVRSFGVSESEALFGFWHYWAATLIFMAIAVWLAKK